MILARFHLLASESAMGTMEKTERASVITPMRMPPTLRFTQQQQFLTHAILATGDEMTSAPPLGFGSTWKFARAGCTLMRE